MLISVHELSHMQKCRAFATEFFFEKWGLGMVPAYLFFLVNDICANIGMALISWPPIHYIHNNGSVRMTKDTYSLGCVRKFVYIC